MKRASTLDNKDRQAAAHHAGAAKADTGNSKEVHRGKADTETSRNSPFQKIRLSSRKESTAADTIIHAKETVPGLASPASPLRGEPAHAGQATARHAAAPCSPNASLPVLHGTHGTRLAATGTGGPAPVPADIRLNGSSSHAQEASRPPATNGDSRRRQWQEKDQPSFIFDEITDPLLLTLFDTGRQATAATAAPGAVAQLSEREQRQQLQPVAKAIRKALEGVLADMTRQFMHTGRHDGIAKPEMQDAHHAFSEMVQMFNRAKVAAVDGQEARMRAELRSICPALDEFLRLRVKTAFRHFSAEKEDRETLKSGLRSLLTQCRAWLPEETEETVRPWSPSSTPASPDARQRAVSSPVKPSEPWGLKEGDRTDRLPTRLSGNISPRPSQHRIPPSGPSAALTPSPTSRPLSTSLSSPVTSPVLNSLPANSPKENTKPSRISTLLASPLSPRSREGGRRESSAKGQGRQPSLSDPASRYTLPAQGGELSAAPETVQPDRNSKRSS